MARHVLKSIFILLIVVIAQVAAFASPVSESSSYLSETKLEQTERLFSACMAADADFCLVKAKPRLPIESSASVNTKLRANFGAAANIRYAANLAAKLCKERNRSLWLVFCALLI